MTVRPLPKALQIKASSELNEVPSRIEEDIKQIREWLEKQPHLRARTDDQWLLNFLRWSKFSIERAKERLDYFYTMRSLTPEFFSNRDPLLPEIQDILKKGCFVPLTNVTDPAAPLTLIVRWEFVSPEDSFADLIKVGLMITDVLLQENDNLNVAGIVLLEDLQHYSVNHMLQSTPSHIKKFLLVVQNAYPLRVKKIHCINLPSYFQAALNLFLAFMNDKLKNRIAAYGKSELNKLYKHIPLSALPKQYGGENGCLNEITAELKKKVEGYRDWFLEDAQYFSDESRRLGTPKTASEIFGVEGSFRKLDVD